MSLLLVTSSDQHVPLLTATPSMGAFFARRRSGAQSLLVQSEHPPQLQALPLMLLLETRMSHRLFTLWLVG